MSTEESLYELFAPKEKVSFFFLFFWKNNFRLKPVALDDNKPSSQPRQARQQFESI